MSAQSARFVSDNGGVENVELAAIIALFVLAAIAAWNFFGGELANFVRGLPGKLGFSG